MPPIGVPNQQMSTLLISDISNWRFMKPMPKIAPTTAWEVETGKPSSVIRVTVAAAATEDTTACFSDNVVILFRVSIGV